MCAVTTFGTALCRSMTNRVCGSNLTLINKNEGGVTQISKGGGGGGSWKEWIRLETHCAMCMYSAASVSSGSLYMSCMVQWYHIKCCSSLHLVYTVLEYFHCILPLSSVSFSFGVYFYYPLPSVCIVICFFHGSSKCSFMFCVKNFDSPP